MKDTRKREPYGAKAGACADCKAVMWRGSTSLPQGQAVCRPCRQRRRDQEPRPTNCVHCGETFESTRTTSNGRGWRRTCSAGCRQRIAAIAGGRAGRAKARTSHEMIRPCPQCGAPALGRTSQRRCDACRADRAKAHNRRKNVIRRGAQVSGPPFTMAQLGAREGWRCHLCTKHVDRRLKSPHPMSATTFDHLIPVAEDGCDAPENLRLAHRICNTRRGTGGVVQLLLVG